MKVLTTLGIFVLSFLATVTASAYTTDRVDKIFAQTSEVDVRQNSSATLAMIQAALSIYTRDAEKNGWGSLAAGNEVQIERYNKNPGGYHVWDHYYTIKNLPVESFDDLVDKGYESDSDVVAVSPRPAEIAQSEGDIEKFLENYQDHGGTVITVWSMFPLN